jgi:ATP-dependent helicase/nuclease subunit B
MGEVATIQVADNAELQHVVRAEIARAQGADPLAPVTVVVDFAAQGWALRRQLAESAPPGSGMANVRAMTLPELMSALGDGSTPAGPAGADPLLEAAVVEALVRAETGPLSASADHPETALRLAALADELAWCRLEPDELDGLASRGVSPTARAAIGFVARARPALESALGTTSWPRAADALCAGLATETAATGAAELGPVIVTCARVPASVLDVLAVLAGHTPVTRVVLSPEDAPIPARVLDFPDPATETAFAVRLAAAAIGAGSCPGRVAILYSVDSPYARLLERALDDAGIAWHGPTGETLRSTTVARCLFALVDLAAARVDGSSGITRPLLMRLLGLGHLSDGPAPVSPGAARALVRQEGLFGDAGQWLGHLAAVGSAAAVDPDDPDEALPRHVNRLAPHAHPLATLIRALDTALGRIVAAGTWSDLGASLWSALESFHLHGTWWTVRPDDAAAVDVVRALLLEGFPTVDALGSQAPEPSAAGAAQTLDRALAARRGRHGASSAGVHVGPVSSSRGLVFDHVIIVGASDGLLPPVRGEDPLLPDAARLHVRRDPDDLPRSFELEGLMARDVRAVAVAAGSCTALLSRGALPGRAVGLPSRYLPSADPDRVASTRASLMREPAPLAPADIAERAALAGGSPDDALRARIDSIAAWAIPEPSPHFGALHVDGAVWSLDDRDLSASGIEQFLHCPYHFFVQRILGFSTDEYADTVDTIAPNDMGTLLHSAFERFVEQSRLDGTLPEAGQAWPDSALVDLRRLIDIEVDAAVRTGLTGWRPAWERSYGVVVSSLPGFLEVDALEVRGEPPTAPARAEQAFGFDGDPVVEFRVSDDVAVRLRGSIDRVDLSADGRIVGVVDYKSGRSSGFAEKLGKPKRDGTPRERQKVQDLVYDAAARVLYPGADRVDVHFLFVPNGGERPAVVTPTHDQDRAVVLRELLLRLESAGQSGTFLPTPQGTRDYCPVCTRLGRRAVIVSGKPLVEDEEEES